MKIGRNTVYIFDNEGETLDRYTIVLKDGTILGASENPYHPQGYGQHCGNCVDTAMHIKFGYGWRKDRTEKEINKVVKYEVDEYIYQARKDKNWLGDEIIDIKQLPEDVVKFIKYYMKKD